MTRTRVMKALIESNLQSKRAEIYSVLKSSPMFCGVASEIRGRKIRFDDHWVIDFASCNYLGLDLDEEVIQSIEPALRNWGVHPSWCRLVASPSLYQEVETRLASLIGAESTLVLPTVTLIHLGVIPALMGEDGVMFLDRTSHVSLYEGCRIARDGGASLHAFDSHHLERLEHLLHQHRSNPKKLILANGVYGISGQYLDVPRLEELAEKYDACLYIDDAHGFGILGESPSADHPYGLRGNGIVQYFGKNYDQTLYVGGLSKAYSSLAAFISCSAEMKRFIQAFATPYDASGPCPTASLQSVLTGLAVNEIRGDEIRTKLYRLTSQAISGLKSLGFHVNNQTGFPAFSIWIGDSDRLIEASQILWNEGVLATVAPYPKVKNGQEAFRITITAGNTEEEIRTLLSAFGKVRDYLIRKKAPLLPRAA